MICESCGKENDDQSKFCIQCGASLSDGVRVQVQAEKEPEAEPELEAKTEAEPEPEPEPDTEPEFEDELEPDAGPKSESEPEPEDDQRPAIDSAISEGMPMTLRAVAIALLVIGALAALIFSGTFGPKNISLRFSDGAASAGMRVEAAGVSHGVQMVAESRKARAAYAKLLADVFAGCDSSFDGHPARLGEKDGHDAYGYFYGFAVGNLCGTPSPELVVFHNQGAVSEADWCGAQVYGWDDASQAVKELSSVTFPQAVESVSFCEAASGKAACARLALSGEDEADRYLLAEPWDPDEDGQALPATALVTLDELGGEDALSDDEQAAQLSPFTIDGIVELSEKDGEELRAQMEPAIQAQEENSYENRKRAAEEAAAAERANMLASFRARYEEEQAIANSDPRFAGSMSEMRRAGAEYGERLTNLMNEIYEWELGLPGADVGWLQSSQANWQAGLDAAQGAVTDEFNASPYSGNMYGMNLSGERFSRAEERIEELLSYAEGLV